MEPLPQNTPDKDTSMSYAQAVQKLRAGSLKKWLIGGLAVAFVLALGYFGFTNTDLFRADITQIAGQDANPEAAPLFIPRNYQGVPGDTGAVDVVANQAITGGVYGLSFRLRFNPQQIRFGSNPVSTTGTALDGMFVQTNTATPGELTVLAVGADPVNVAANGTLLHLSLTIDPSVPFGTAITLTPGNVELSVDDPDNAGTPIISNAIRQMAAGSILIQSVGDLKALYAEALSATQVQIHFSDFLRNLNNVAYNITASGGLTVRGIEIGPDQKSLIVTTGAQTGGRLYRLTLKDGTVEGNTEGAISADFDQVAFYGFGSGGDALSDFRIRSARATGYRTVSVTFSDNLQAGTVYREAFRVFSDFNVAPLAVAIDSVTVSGNTVELAMAENLTERGSYLVAIQDPAAGNAPRRDGDGATLGIDTAVFSGFRDGPRIMDAVVQEIPAVAPATVPTYEVRVRFDEPMDGTIDGDLIRTGTTTSAVPGAIDDTVASFNADNTVLTITGFENDPALSYTYLADGLQNADGVPIDPSFSRAAFYGSLHDNILTDVSALTITNRNTFTLGDRTFGFTGADVDLYTYDNTGNPQGVAIESANAVGNSLTVTTDNDLAPDTAYILVLTKAGPAGAGPLTVAVPFSVPYGLNVRDAVAESASRAVVTFDRNVDEQTLNAANFLFGVGQAAQAVAVVDGNFSQVAVTPPAGFTLDAGNVYDIRVRGVRSFEGGRLLSRAGASFGGFRTEARVSPARLESVQAVSPTEIRVTFSDSVDVTTLTPVNFSLHTPATLATPDQPALRVTGVTVENNRNALLTTARQQHNTNYFVVIQNIRDANGALIGNARLLNVIGFAAPAPAVATIEPADLINDAATPVVITGSNLSRVAVVRVGATEAKIDAQTDTRIDATVPAGVAPGLHNLVLTDVEGESVTVRGAVLVGAPVQRMRVVSAESKAIPNRVPNDGKTETTLWVLVEDPHDVDNIDRVVVDLTQIGGAPAQRMTPKEDNKTDRRQWFTHTVTIPLTVATRSEPYLLPVTAKNASQTDEAKGTASIVVSKDVQQSVAPVIQQAYINPVSVPPDGKTEARITARITDEDGISTVTSIVADMGPVGAGFVTLKPAADAATGGELTTGSFTSEVFTIPSTTPVGDYKVLLTVSDDSGETVTDEIDFSVSASLTGPTIDAAQSYIGPRRSIPKTGDATFSVHVFVSDPDTLADISAVTVNLRNVGGVPTPLKLAADTEKTARSGWFAAEGLKVAGTAPLGVQTLEVTATDVSGARSSALLQLEVTEVETLGDSPRVRSNQSYTTPAVAVNDGETTVTLYAFISDDDDDIQSVIVKLKDVARVGGEPPPSFGQTTAPATPLAPTAPAGTGAPAATPPAPSAGSAGGVCPTIGNILCMTPSVKEGVDGQWFILPNVVVPATTVASTEPYQLEVIATDQTGKIGRGTIPLHVNDGGSYTNDRLPPEIILAVSTGPSTVEILFNEEIDATTISKDGRQFVITDRNNVADTLAVSSAAINATGTIVTLTTEPQETGKYYVLSGTSQIRDSVGVALVAGGNNRVSLVGFEPKDRPPVVEYIAAADVDTIEVEFRDYLRPSSLILTPNRPAGVEQQRIKPRLRGAHDLNVEIYESGATSRQVQVRGVEFGNDANLLMLHTEPLRAGERYRVNFKKLASFDGVSATASINKMVKGVAAVQQYTGELDSRADFNGDGKIDFLDFTMFSSVYGTGGTSAPAPQVAPGPSPRPIPPVPDSATPHTAPVGQ